MQGLTFSSKLDWGSYIIFIAKSTFKKIGALIRSVKFFCLKVVLYLPYNHAWNTVAMPGLVLLIATWNC